MKKNLKKITKILQNRVVRSGFKINSKNTQFCSTKTRSKLFSLADDILWKDEKLKKRNINKGFYTRTIIFDNVAITFKRRKYLLRKEFQNSDDKTRTCFLLDKYLRLEKYQRIILETALNIVSKVGSNFSYQDIANQHPNIRITKQMVFYLAKKFNIDDLILKLTTPQEKRLKHDGVIYVECDDGFKNAITSKGIKMKAIHWW